MKNTYNTDGNTRTVANDQDAYLVSMIHRGQKKYPAWWLMSKTRKCFKHTSNIDNIKFSILNPGVCTIDMQLFSDRVTRFAVALECNNDSGHTVDGVDYKYSKHPVIEINRNNVFSSYNYGLAPRLMLYVDLIN